LSKIFERAPGTAFGRRDIASAEGATTFLRTVYGWMCVGLAITALVAYSIASSPVLVQALVMNHWLFLGLFVAQIALVFFPLGPRRLGRSRTARLLVLSQVVLSMQFCFALFPLVIVTSGRRKMGEFANSGWIKALAWAVAALIAGLNGWPLQMVRT
jgi:Mn2+/Fe2+ NRAMP family transporter